MDRPFLLLGQDAGTTADDGAGAAAPVVRDLVHKLDILNRPDELLDLISGMPFVLASAIIIIGLLCVLNGYRWHRWVVIVLAFLTGLALGREMSHHFGRSDIVAASIGLLCAIVATPMLRIAVALFGGATGAFVGANAWTAFNASQADVHWAGAAIGFVVVAMASFILFRLVVVLFTSVGGAAMVVFGAICLMMHVEAWEPAIREHLEANQAVVPLLVAIAAVTGFVLQESRTRGESAED